MIKKIITKIIEHKKIIGAAITIIGVFSFAMAGLNLTKSIQNASLEFGNWYDQLPQQHWLKTKNDEYEAFIQLLELKGTTEAMILPTFEFAGEALKQESKLGEGLALMISREFEKSKPKFVLQNSSGKSTKKIKMSVDQTQKFMFNCDGKALPFDVSEKEFLSGIIPVISYIENPEIAKISNGEVTGLKPGKTNLIICCGVYKLTYPINIR